MIIGVSYRDECYLNEFKAYLLDKKDEFIELFNKNNDVHLPFCIVPEAVHLKPWIEEIVQNDFKKSLSEKIGNYELRFLKFEHVPNEKNRFVISLRK